MARKSLAATVCALSVLGLSVYVLNRGFVAKTENPDEKAERAALPAPPDGSESVPDVRVALERARERAEHTRKQRLAARQEHSYRPAPAKSSPPSVSPAAVLRVRQNFQGMLAVQGLFNMDTSREALADALLESPDDLQAVKETLSDEGFARRTFGEEQAAARFFAVYVLVRAVERGIEAPLYAATSAIANASTRGDLSEGRRLDLAELLVGFARAKSPDYFAGATPELLSRLGYRGSLPDGVREIYEDAIFAALYHRIGRAKARAVIDHLMTG